MLDQESRHHPLPCRRIRVNQSAKRAGLAPHDLAQARALLRHKDVVLRSIAQARDDAMLAADELRLERDTAHAECARLRVDASIAGLVALSKAARARGEASRYRSMYGDAFIVLTECATVAARLVQVICEDAERIATLTAERDHALGVPVAQDQEDVVDAIIHCRGCFCPAEPDTVATLRLWERQRVREALHEAGMHEAAALVAVLRHEATR